VAGQGLDRIFFCTANVLSFFSTPIGVEKKKRSTASRRTIAVKNKKEKQACGALRSSVKKKTKRKPAKGWLPLSLFLLSLYLQGDENNDAVTLRC
jgi:hypothetical protein